MAAVPRLGGALAAHIDLDQRAPADLEAHADATWGDRNVYALVLTSPPCSRTSQSNGVWRDSVFSSVTV